MSEREKKKCQSNTKDYWRNSDYNQGAEKDFSIALKVDKGKPKPEESIAQRVQLRRERMAEIEREEKNINNKLFKEYFTDYRSPIVMYKKLGGTRNDLTVKPNLKNPKKNMALDNLSIYYVWKNIKSVYNNN